MTVQEIASRVRVPGTAAGRAVSWSRRAAGSLALAALAVSGHAIEPGAAVRTREVLRTTHAWNGSPIELPAGPAEVVGAVVEIAPGGETGWHSHAEPSFAYVMEGTLEVRLESGAVKRVGAGDALVEVVGIEHNGRNVGDGPVRLVVFHVAERSPSERAAGGGLPPP